MSLLSYFIKNVETLVTNERIVSKQTFNYLVTAALQEELNAFYELTSKITKHSRREGGAVELHFEHNKRDIRILAYTANKMGMPYNAAAIMRIISIHQPIYTF